MIKCINKLSISLFCHALIGLRVAWMVFCGLFAVGGLPNLIFADGIEADLLSPAERAMEGVLAGAPPAEFIPTLVTQPGEPRFITVDFTNTTNANFAYHIGSRPGEMHFLQVYLYRDGELIFSTGPCGEGPYISAGGVRQLEPGGTIQCHIDLDERYPDLEGGEYVVRARYAILESSWFVTEYGMTPLTFDRVIMNVLIR